VAASACASLPLASQAQTFPQKPVSIVVAYSPGGATDRVARLLGKHLSQSLGQPVLIENKPGASGNIGSTYVARAEPDGYTVLFATQPMVAINPLLFKQMEIDPGKDLTPITAAVSDVVVIAVNADVPVNSMAELIDYVKKNPGTPYGTSGVGTPMHIGGLLLNQRAGIELNHIAYKGAGPMITDLVGGTVKVGIVGLSVAKPFADEGRLKILAVGGKERFKGAPEIPTISETVPDFELTSWFAFLGPAGMPEPLVQRWNDEIQAALREESVQKTLYSEGIVVDAHGPEHLEKLIASDLEHFGRILKDNNIEAQ